MYSFHVFSDGLVGDGVYDSVACWHERTAIVMLHELSWCELRCIIVNKAYETVDCIL